VHLHAEDIVDKRRLRLIGCARASIKCIFGVNSRDCGVRVGSPRKGGEGRYAGEGRAEVREPRRFITHLEKERDPAFQGFYETLAIAAPTRVYRLIVAQAPK
jgi:hypothetical protein